MKRNLLRIVGGLAVLALVVAAAVALGRQAAPATVQAAGAAESPSTADARQDDADRGLVIVAVDADGPAAGAGVKRGDILLSLNDTEVNSQRDLVGALDDLKSGDEVALTVLHGDDRRMLTATLGERSGRAYLGLTTCGGPHVIVDEVFPAEPLRGAIVVKVVADSPADQAGLEEGDRIVAVDGQELNGDNNLAESIAAHEPGDRVTLTVERPGEESREVTVTLGTHPDEAGKAYLGVEYAPFSSFGKLPDGAVPFPRDFGEARPFTAPVPDIEGLDGGAIVIEVVEDSPAEAAGLQAGDIITAIEGKPLTQPNDVRAAVDARAPGDKLTLSVRRQEEDLEITATLAESPDEAGQAYLGVRIGGFFFSHKFEGIGPDEFRGIVPHFEFGWPFEGFGSGERPDEIPETPDTSTTL